MPNASKPSALSKVNEWVTMHLSRVPFQQKILFVHNLYIMIKAGLSIVDALRILGEQIENKRLKQTVINIKSQVEKGEQLSEVLAMYPKIFPSIYVSMIGAGEAAGKMEDALFQVHNQMKKSQELTSRIHGALIYPAIVLVAMTGIGIEMVVFVLPKLLVMFNDFHAELPMATRILIWIVNSTSKYGIFIVMAVVGMVFFFSWLFRKTRPKQILHKVFLHIPIAGTVITKINLSRFTLTLSSLLQSTIPIIEAVRITSQVLGNLQYRMRLETVSEALKRGEPLSESLGKYPHFFPAMLVQMIMVGEQSGQVEQMLAELSEYYGNEVDNTMRNFSTIIEPVIILMLGLAVAGIAVAVIMPVYSLAQSF